MIEANTYWEKRCVLSETAVQQLAQIIVDANPMLMGKLQSWTGAWEMGMQDIDAEEVGPEEAGE